LAFEGRLVVVGFASGRAADLPTNHLLVKNYSVLGLQWPAYERHHPQLVRAAHEALVDLHRRGHVRPLVGTVADLDDAPAQLAALAAGRTVGKVVVQP
jgi:NADPH2:quinone reductase